MASECRTQIKTLPAAAPVPIQMDGHSPYKGGRADIFALTGRLVTRVFDRVAADDQQTSGRGYA
ncbi:MAG TPA: hypothetical protein VGF67_18920 [Ktedonobacteraceae bacterium]